MSHKAKTAFILSLLSLLTLFANESLRSQNRPIPITIGIRRAIITRSYVLQIQNSSKDSLNLWLQAKDQIFPFLLPVGKMKEFGWRQGFHFDAKNLFRIGASGYDTLTSMMPDSELAPWRIDFPKEGGLGLSFSQSYLQDQAKNLKLSFKKELSPAVEITLNQVPEIELKEGSDRIYANLIFQASLFSRNLNVPIVARISFIPFYDPTSGQITTSQIRLEGIEINPLLSEYLKQITQTVNDILPIFSNRYVIRQLSKTEMMFAKLGNMRDARVIERRLEFSIL